MANNKEEYPMVGFRYEVNVIAEIKEKEFSANNVKSLAGSSSGDGGFSEVSGVSVSFETEDIEDGEGNIYPLPKQRKYTPLTLKRGLTGVQSPLVTWVAEMIIGEKTKSVVETKSVVVKLLSDTGDPLVYWVFNGAYPTKWTVSGLKAMSNELVIEEMEIKYKSFHPVFLG